MSIQVAFLAFVLSGCGVDRNSPDAETAILRFSAIPDQNTTRLKQKFDPVGAHLSSVLGVPVEYIPATDYTAVVQMFKGGDIQLAWFGGLTGVQARAAVPGARAIAQGAEDPEYRSYFIVHHSVDLARSKEFPSAIRDLSFTFGSDASTSGRLMPEFFIREESGLSPGDFFTQQPGFSGSHDKTAKMVESGAVQAGAISYKAYEALVERGAVDPKLAKIIWETPSYPDYNFTAHPSLDATFGEGFTDKLQAALLGISDPSLLDAFPRSSLIAAKNADFDRVEDVAQLLKMVR